MLVWSLQLLCSLYYGSEDIAGGECAYFFVDEGVFSGDFNLAVTLKGVFEEVNHYDDLAPKQLGDTFD